MVRLRQRIPHFFAPVVRRDGVVILSHSRSLALPLYLLTNHIKERAELCGHKVEGEATEPLPAHSAQHHGQRLIETRT